MNNIADIITNHSSSATGISPPKPKFKPIVEPIQEDSPEEDKPLADASDNNFDKENIKKQIYSIKDQLDSLLRMINGEKIKNNSAEQSISPTTQKTNQGEKIIEGVFNGEKMIGSDGQEYAIPPNYASKSKLIEGDMMKLTITDRGSFIYKQIGPAKRKRLIGKLEFDQENQMWEVSIEENKYKVLTASITFYKGKPGDEAVILVPENGKSDWAAVENVITK